MILLSIIIPAYNAEKYIVACLSSCFALQSEQWLSEDELEVIVVDDGSTDSTRSLLANEQTKHRNLSVLCQPNQGQSVARNLAIESAHGRYIYMVDSDDALNDAQSLPYNDLREGLYDIIGVQVLYHKENGEVRPWSHQMEHWPFDQEFASGADFVRNHNIEGLVYGYFFKRQLFADQPELRFTPGIYHQDEELIFKIFTLAGRTVYRRGYTYLYYEHTGSSINTRTEERRRKLLADDIVILRNLLDWRRQHHLYSVMHYKLAYLAMDTLRYLIRNQYDRNSCTITINNLRKMGLYPLPTIKEIKFLAIKLLTCHPRLVIWLAGKKSLSRKIGF